MRPEEQSEKTESCRENLWNKIQLKGPHDRNRHKSRTKKSGQARLVYVFDINGNNDSLEEKEYGDSRDTS